MQYRAAILGLIPSLVVAITPPNIDGMTIQWSEAFKGSAGSSPSDQWNVMDAIDTNNEVQTYTTSNNNLQISGGETIQFVPRKSSAGHWSSGRIETKDSFTPAAGKIMKIQSSILLGDNAATNKQGVWPAFWALGQAMREGTSWPMAGEIDIFEQVNGVATGYGTLHCGTSSGGPCNEPSGLATSIPMPTTGFNTWAVTIDLTNSDWAAQTMTWQLNGATYKTTTGSDIGDQATWATLAHSPVYVILNVAIGGDWPGPPNDSTEGGYGAMMEVQYVAVYSS
ncbi:beta-glucanase [Xylariaceae sp. FL0016]|nr:beta-glucanase [Xylariaceae sp. FL0016]